VLTPVPGGVGPVTTGVLMQHTIAPEDLRERGRTLRVGDRVFLRRAGDVIPEIVRVIPESRLPDSKPWENDPAASLYTTSKWTPGDKTSWEAALRTRNLAQNEYNRVQ